MSGAADFFELGPYIDFLTAEEQMWEAFSRDRPQGIGPTVQAFVVEWYRVGLEIELGYVCRAIDLGAES